MNPFDLSWKNILYHIHPRLLSFVLNSMINSLPTPDMLRLWIIHSDASCPLCTKSPCTLHHILVNCPFSLFGKRYTWRHDSVLLTLQPYVLAQIKYHNTHPLYTNTPHPLQSSCVRSGAPIAKRKQKTSYLNVDTY